MFSLYIEYGKEWVDDLLGGMSECSGFLDYPVYCQDGISWSNKLVLGNFQLLDFSHSSIFLPEHSEPVYYKF